MKIREWLSIKIKSIKQSLSAPSIDLYFVFFILLVLFFFLIR